MGANEWRRTVRRRRMARLRKRQAVSPVVATLILILIAVAAAAALYLWLVAWQGGVTKNVGNPNTQTTVDIGGSTAMYAFDQLAVAQFEANNSGIAISDNQGGTGAGLLAVCDGNIDIGTAAAPEVASTLQTSDGCPSTVTVTTVAYDAVDIIVPTANTHGLVSITAATLEAVFVAGGDGGSTAGLTGGISTSYSFAADDLPAPGTTGFAWDQIPACAPTTTATCDGAIEADTGTAGTCGTWTVCATGTQTIATYDRSDNSASDQVLTGRLMGVGDSAGTTAGLSFTGCGSNGQLTSCGLNEPNLAYGDEAMISDVAANPNALGFASDGDARATGSNVAIVPLEGVGQTAAVLPTTGSSGTIAAGVTGNLVSGYVGWRPFEYVTTSPPTGEVERFIQWVTDPANNGNIATESHEISVYSV